MNEQQICAQCKSEVPPRSRFCGACGYRLTNDPGPLEHPISQENLGPERSSCLTDEDTDALVMPAVAGWYPDPLREGWAREFDGEKWLNYQREIGVGGKASVIEDEPRTDQRGSAPDPAPTRSSTNSTNFQAVPKDPASGSSRPRGGPGAAIRPDRAWVLGVAVCAVIGVLAVMIAVFGPSVRSKVMGEPTDSWSALRICEPGETSSAGESGILNCRPEGSPRPSAQAETPTPAPKRAQPSVQQVTVPNVVGLPTKLANETLRSYGLTSNGSGYGYCSIASQSPRPGSLVRVGSYVSVTLSCT